MSKNNENKLVPKLRFPDFIQDGNWESDSVQNLISTIAPAKKLNSSEYFTKGKYPIVDQSQDFYCGWTDDSDAVISNNLPLIIFGDHTCILKLVHEPFAQGADGIKIIKPKGALITEFLFQHFNFNGVKQDGYKRHYSILKEKIVSYPNIKTGEQQKIAACLSSLDEVITAESQKLGVLKDHKKGLLQNLLPQAGETVPKFRFKEFENSGEWEEKCLGEVADVITGNTPTTSERDYYGGNKMLVSPADINDNRFVVEAKTTLTELGFSKTRKIRANSVLFVCIGSTIGKVAQNKIECATNQQINSLVPFKEYSSAFLYSLLEANSQKIASLAGKQAVPLINKTTFSLVKLPFPSDLAEQQKIADTLSSVDDLINAQNQKIETLKQHKKGLLQGLFPNVSPLSP